MPMTRFAGALAAGLFAILAAGAAPAQSLTTTEAVERLFHYDIQADWFTADFLAQVSVDQLETIIGQLTGEFGDLDEITGEGANLSVRLERAELPTFIRLDGGGRIAALLFQGAIPIGGSLAEFVDTIRALPGQSSVLVTTNGTVVAEHDPDAALAVGSAAKLAILKALEDAIAAGTTAPEEVLPFAESWRTIGSGMLHNWPADTPITVATLANLMISISDNTATDALIEHLGRAAIEAHSPRNTPFPKTSDIFKLNAGNPELRAAWLAADAAGRAALLEQLAAQPLPTNASIEATVIAAEWYLTATELCGLLEAVADNPAFTINPGPLGGLDYASVAFKGGSDTGVLNFSTRFVDNDGETHCVAATWNDTAALDQQQLVAPYRGILRYLAEDEAAKSP